VPAMRQRLGHDLWRFDGTHTNRIWIVYQQEVRDAFNQKPVEALLTPA
jgi:hypothetical protein